MKTILLYLILFAGMFSGRNSNVMRLQTVDQPKLDLIAESHILMEYESGLILYEHDADKRLYPASMTKMMGMLLVLEEIDSHRLNWDDIVRGSAESSSMGGTQIYLAPNEEMKVSDLFKAVAVNSANDAIVALGEKVSGSHSAFVRRMNERAAELETTNTNFKNATGFDDPEHYTSARDMAIIGRQLLTHGEDILKYSRMKEAYIRENTDNPFWLVNTNKLLGNYEGLDGLKTGFTSKAGYNLTATAYRSGVRLISVTIGAKTIKDRSHDTVTMMNHGFSQVKSLAVFDRDQVLGHYSFKNGLTKDTPLYPLTEVRPVFDKDTKIEDLEYLIVLTKLSAPLLKDAIVGDLIVKDKKGNERRYPVIIKDDVEGMDYFDYFFESLRSLFA